MGKFIRSPMLLVAKHEYMQEEDIKVATEGDNPRSSVDSPGGAGSAAVQSSLWNRACFDIPPYRKVAPSVSCVNKFRLRMANRPARVSHH